MKLSKFMKLEINNWTHHLNQLIYSYLYFCKKEAVEFIILGNKYIKNGGAVITVDQIKIFFDYSDDSKFMDMPEKYSFYFKRSLIESDRVKNVYPLNFNIPLSFKSHLLLSKLKANIIFDKLNRTEVIRAMDVFSLFTNSSHNVIDINNYPTKIVDYGGKVLFYTRLWNPDNHPDSEEKERRILQNEFRINACRIIKKNYRTASVGLYQDALSQKVAPDLVLSSKYSNKKDYFKLLKNFDIGVADDGLKDTPGWKIGEYLLFGKAVITTPINIVLDDFQEHINYEQVSTRTSYLELPEKIDCILKNKKYLEVGQNNLNWSKMCLHPENYIKRILNVIGLEV